MSLLIRPGYAWIVSVLSPLLLLGSAVSSVIVLTGVYDQEAYTVSTVWISVSSLKINAGIVLNNTSAVMLAVVNVISFLVHLFSTGYMAGDAAEKRYFGMLGLFTFCMSGIVLADNLLILFMFWEGVGFASYMLIGHWQDKTSAALASRKAFLLNRVGDAGFIVALMILYNLSGTFSIDALATGSTGWHTAAALFLFAGVAGKSAQFPLFTWLPDAMEGPTPVSALIHAATMVAAGVYLLVRTFHILTPDALIFIAITGSVTALVAALAALVQNDIKKILAYSTISQLGLMITAIGAGAPGAAFLHLFTHAFFKACLFLSAGSVIHILDHARHQAHLDFDVQDVRNLGGLQRKLPFTFLAVLVSGASLAGIPFFSGFLSKEAILSALMEYPADTHGGKWVILLITIVVMFLTVAYMFRCVSRIFLGESRVKLPDALPGEPFVMRAPVALLAACSLWFIVSINPLDARGWLSVSLRPAGTTLTLFSIAWVGLALLVSWIVMKKDRWPQSQTLMHTFYLDRLYNMLFAHPVVALATYTEKSDRRIIDGFLHALAYGQIIIAHLAAWCDRAIIDGSVNGAATLARVTGSFARSFQGGKIQLYIFWALFAIIIFLIWSLI